MNTQRLSLAAGGTMIILAVLTDFVQFLLDIAFIGIILDTIISIFASFIFGVSFSHYDMSLMSSERVLGFSGTVLGEVVPVVDAIPFWSLFITTTVFREWMSPPGI